MAYTIIGLFFIVIGIYESFTGERGFEFLSYGYFFFIFSDLSDIKKRLDVK